MSCTDPYAIEAARRTDHPRYLELLDPGHPDYDPRYGPVVRAIAEAPQSAPAAPSPRFEPVTRAWLDLINSCPWRECRTGCQRSLCHAGRGDGWGQTTLANCRDCLRLPDAESPHRL